MNFSYVAWNISVGCAVVSTQLTLTASTFNQLDQYASSRGKKGLCYAKLVTSLAVATTVVSTHDTLYFNSFGIVCCWIFPSVL